MGKESGWLNLKLKQLYMTVFLNYLSTFMVIPAITDVTMSALCPGKYQCSLAIYLTGIQQAIVGIGTLVMMPLVGYLSDKYGRKALLTLPLSFTIIPLGILACGRSRNYYYAYYVVRTLTSMVCEGSVHCLALAYVADNVPEGKRVSAFGILSGISSCAFVCGNLSTRFLSTPLTFQVAASVSVIAAVYMRVFLPESVIDNAILTPLMSKENKIISEVKDESKRKIQLFKAMPSIQDMVALLKTSPTFSQAAVVAFFITLSDGGLYASLMYYLKARFHFNKDQFADLMVINGVAGTISQLIVMPILAPLIGETWLLCIGLFFSCVHMFLYAVAWSFWVAYASAVLSIFYVFAQPCMRSIVSKQVGSCEQGKAQGCISGISSLANVISPLAFSPLTALFLSERAPFSFPGFSIMCTGFVAMIAFIQSVMIRPPPPVSDLEAKNCSHTEP